MGSYPASPNHRAGLEPRRPTTRFRLDPKLPIRAGRRQRPGEAGRPQVRRSVERLVAVAAPADSSGSGAQHGGRREEVRAERPPEVVPRVDPLAGRLEQRLRRAGISTSFSGARASSPRSALVTSGWNCIPQAALAEPERLGAHGAPPSSTAPAGTPVGVVVPLNTSTSRAARGGAGPSAPARQLDAGASRSRVRCRADRGARRARQQLRAEADAEHQHAGGRAAG